MLSRLVNEEGGGMTQPSPEQLRQENEIARGENSLSVGRIEKGTPSLFTCPECHGVLLRLSSSDGVRFRCHTGHAFTARTLLVELSESIENTLWNTVRAVQEGGILLRHLAGHARGTGHTDIAEQYDAKAAEAESRAERLRELVVDHERTGQDETVGRPPKVGPT
jgi:two-component system chemotaxis response regulator CheB